MGQRSTCARLRMHVLPCGARRCEGVLRYGRTDKRTWGAGATLGDGEPQTVSAVNYAITEAMMCSAPATSTREWRTT